MVFPPTCRPPFGFLLLQLCRASIGPNSAELGKHPLPTALLFRLLSYWPQPPLHFCPDFPLPLMDFPFGLGVFLCIFLEYAVPGNPFSAAFLPSCTVALLDRNPCQLVRLSSGVPCCSDPAELYRFFLGFSFYSPLRGATVGDGFFDIL